MERHLANDMDARAQKGARSSKIASKTGHWHVVLLQNPWVAPPQMRSSSILLSPAHVLFQSWKHLWIRRTPSALLSVSTCSLGFVSFLEMWETSSASIHVLFTKFFGTIFVRTCHVQLFMQNLCYCLFIRISFNSSSSTYSRLSEEHVCPLRN